MYTYVFDVEEAVGDINFFDKFKQVPKIPYFQFLTDFRTETDTICIDQMKAQCKTYLMVLV